MKHLFVLTVFVFAVSASFLVTTAAAAPLQVAETLTLVDCDGTKVTFSETDLRSMEQVTEEQCIWVGESSGYIGIFDCSGVLLSEILQRAEATFKAKDFVRENTYVIFRGTDDYQIITSWTELMGSADGLRSIIMLDKDGEPLSDEEGKFRVLFPADKYVGRSVKCLDSIEIHRAEGFKDFPKDKTPAEPEKQ